ncbi:2-oxoacid:ferredoxin oxidoreductase, beta subunit, putative [Heliomicrobium modesticaldum Ice1]|uniref:2-oxoacid:ferredoxin oxidoreductase, beta subunit, putative n=1 Tax=Heliobacterium modesticaldum (strain ATCC 51547 / Ice1) TaxID=498761 RepID=B0TFJ6_HELMI|nr:indolepyruvate oxidoreductase subunit beta [Heliomicrobium modesticaldum]ABZ83095.1 2-oxoacid:ferredoxin oxidoreductase, beta subunit, putative [Heliomicrobium modesticaldum Ice1]
MKTFNLIITGVGGQGGVLASRLFAEAALAAGYKVRTSETIGMAQREGSVISHVRVGERLWSALIPDGAADVLISLELAEGLKGWTKVAPHGRAIINRRPIIPPAASLGLTRYDEGAIIEFLQQQGQRVHLIDATAAALETGNAKTTNMVMLGALSTLPGLPVTADMLWQAAEALLPARLREINRQAFLTGRSLGSCAGTSPLVS